VLHARPPTAVVDAGSTGEGWLFSEYERLVDSLKIRHDTLRAGARIPAPDDIRIMCLYPHPGEVQSEGGQPSNLNDESIVLKIVYGKTSLLMMGDAEEGVERRLIAEYGQFLHADVIKIGHHGSSTSSSPTLLDFVTPRVGVISVGLHNRFHHPSPVVVERYRQRHVEIHRTDESGAVILESDGSSWRTVAWQ
jgi:competence protein ComEC